MQRPFGERLRAAYKTLFNSGNWVDSNQPGNRYTSLNNLWTPGSQINWDSVTGQLWEGAVGYSALVYFAGNYNLTEMVIQQKNERGEVEQLPNHPALAEWLHPNPEYDAKTLNFNIVLSLKSSGNAYIAIERDNAGRIVEQWWLPHHVTRPVTAPGSKNIIDYYEYRAGGKIQQIDVNNMRHLRFGIDPYDMRVGLSPYAAMVRQRYTMEQAITYRAAVLKNKGSIGAIAMPLTADQPFDTQLFTDMWDKMRVGSDNAGTLAAFSVPIDLKLLKNSPADMSLETIEDKPESDLCAILGVPPQCLGLYAGRLSKTYANAAEARQNFCESTLLPFMGMVDSQKTMFAMREGELQTGQYFARDTSKLPPLQPDLDKKHLRVREDWKADLIDRATALRLLGMLSQPEDEGMYFSMVVPAGGTVMPIVGRESGMTPTDVQAAQSDTTGNARSNGYRDKAVV